MRKEKRAPGRRTERPLAERIAYTQAPGRRAAPVVMLSLNWLKIEALGAHLTENSFLEVGHTRLQFGVLHIAQLGFD